MIFTWHFTHAFSDNPVPVNYITALFPFSLLAAGHTGVALFMTLSGYLFAKLLDGKTIDYRAFIWNRVLRLFPLLVVVILIVGAKNVITGQTLYSYACSIAKGVILPTLPNGAWSITIEFHYYIVLPMFLWMFRKSKMLPISIIIAAIALRLFIYHEKGEIQSLAYWTIIGRIDQFAIGMIIYQFRVFFTRRHVLAITVIIGFSAFYWYFNLIGGFYQNPSYPSPSPLWLILPTIEGIAYAVGIAWYESSFFHSTTGLSRFIGRIGEFSYSIYLLHWFVVIQAARFVQERIMNISNFYLACFWSTVFFLLMIPAGYLSFRFIETPFLRLRKRYIIVPHNSAETVCHEAHQSAPTDALKRAAEL